MSVIELSQVLGNFGEFFGAFAVVATLMYLAVQIRESKKVALAQAYQGRAMMRQQGHMLAADSDHLAPLLGRVRAAGWPEKTDVVAELSPEEKERLNEYIIQTLIHLDNVLYQQELGLLDQNLTTAVRSAADAYAPTIKLLGKATTLPPRVLKLLDESPAV
jgi:hypothetical protein